MDIEDLLISYMIDVYEQYCYYALNMTQTDFDSSFYDSEGNEISDREYLITNYQNIYMEEVFESLYEILLDENNDKSIDVKRLVNFFAGTYFVYNYDDGKNNVIRYLKDTPYEKIEELFRENMYFGVDMIKSYFLGIVDRERCKNNKDVIVKNGDEDVMNKFFNQAIKQNIITLNDLLRNIVCDLYNHFIENGCGDIDSLNNTWQYFLSDFDPLGTLDRMGVDVSTKDIYKRYMLGLIISDLYEDVCNKSIIQSENKEDRMAQVFPVLLASLGVINIPEDKDLRNRVLKYFILLQDEKEKRKENRTKTYSDKRVNTLKRINPLYQLDDLTFTQIK